MAGQLTTPFTPTIDPAYWERLREPTMRVVALTAHVGLISAPELATAAARFLLWAWQTTGEEPSADVFRRDVIERYIDSAKRHTYTPAGANTIRSRLLRIQEAVNPASTSRRPLRPLGASPGSAPYSDAEIARLRSWAATQTTVRRRSDADVLLALGLGAGLYGAEIIRTARADIITTSEGVDVLVHGEMPRIVPLLAEWAATLQGQDFDPNDPTPVFRPGRQAGHNANLITDLVSRGHIADPSTPGKSLQIRARRMRSTWIVRHLEAGTATLPLLQAAGVANLQALDRFIVHAKRPEQLDQTMRLP